jgi:transposase
MVRQLIAENGQLRAENTHLREGIEQLKRRNARSAAPFSKDKREKNPKRPGRKPGQGEFGTRPVPPERDYSGPPVDVPVSETVCPECGGDLMDEGEEIVTNTEIPPAPRPEVKAYRVRIRVCCKCKRKVRGQHPEVAHDQCGVTAHRLGPRAQAAAHLLYYQTPHRGDRQLPKDPADPCPLGAGNCKGDPQPQRRRRRLSFCCFSRIIVKKSVLRRAECRPRGTGVSL